MTSQIKRTRFLFLALLAGMVLAGCVQESVRTVNPTETVLARADIPEDQLLDVGIELFDPGIPEDEAQWEAKRVFPTVRKAEARYLPMTLKDTLQKTGHWGSIWVIPSDSVAVDVLVSGKILYSDGEKLKLKIEARDATGRVWLNRKYEGEASKYAYNSELGLEYDAFQDVYNRIANDLAATRGQLSAAELEDIRRVAELRFATEFSPDAFDDYLTQEKRSDRYVVNRLPAVNDPMMLRMYKIREREYMFFDVLDEHYTNFYRSMEKPYQDWREYSYEETIALREVRQSARRRMLIGAAAVVGGIIAGQNADSYATSVASNALVVGGFMAAKSGYDRAGQAKIHVEALRELGGSLEAEVRPIVVQVEGQTVELTGSVESQYAEWRKLLRDIYVLETGLPVAADEKASAPAEQPAD